MSIGRRNTLSKKENQRKSQPASNRVAVETDRSVGATVSIARSGVRTDERSEDRPKAHLSGRAKFLKQASHLVVTGFLFD